MDDRGIDGLDNREANDEEVDTLVTSSIDTNAEEHTGRGRNGRRRPHRIGEEIELYCNPFVEVYGRLSMWARRLTRRWLEEVVGMLIGVQENLIWREILYVVDHTAW